jgi:putative MATE family efflux protein
MKKLTQEERFKLMTEGKLKPLIVKLAIPTVISQLITTIYSMADTFFVNQISDSAGAAITAVFSVQTLIQAIGFTIGIGTGALLSRALGEQENEKANMFASQGLFMALILGLLFCIFGLTMTESILRLIGCSETALPYAKDFVSYIFIAVPFMMCSFVMNNILRGEGKAVISMIGLTTGGLLNMALDPLFIYAFKMGVAGAGLATMISQIVSFTLLCSFFIFKQSNCKIGFNHLTRDYKTYLLVLANGSPTLFRQGFATTSNICLTFLSKPFGDSITTALGIASKLYSGFRSLIVGTGQGYQPVLGYNYGAKKYDRVKEAFYFTMLLQTIIGLSGTLILLILPRQIASVFTSSSDALEMGEMAIRFLAISLPVLGFSTIVNQSLQVIGYSVSASFLASLRQGLIYTPFIFLFTNLWGTTGLALTQPLSDVATSLISIPFLFYFFNILKNKKEQEQLII